MSTGPDAASGAEHRLMTPDEAIEQMRDDPQHRDLIRDSYLDADTLGASERFADSAEFAEVVRLVGGFEAKEVLDLGAGTGIATLAIARAGAARVFALEPDPSTVLGRGAIASIVGDEPIEIIDGFGEEIPLPGGCVDVVFARQVLHHTHDLDLVGREIHRVLRPGGVFIACREHVVDDEAEMAEFLARHPVHQLAGGESAYSLPEYQRAIRSSGLRLRETWATWDSIITAYPNTHSQQELDDFRRHELGLPLARMGRLAAKLPITSGMVRRRLAPYVGPGRMYSFLAQKPG